MVSVCALNRIVFRSQRNECSLLFALSDDGRAFPGLQARAVATGEARGVEGTFRVDVAADRRRRRIYSTLAVF